MGFSAWAKAPLLCAAQEISVPGWRPAWSSAFRGPCRAMTGGSPCQGVTRVNVEAQGWREERTLLVAEIPRITALVREAAPFLGRA